MNLKVREYAQSLLEFEEALTQKEQEKGQLVESYENVRREADDMAITLRELQGRLTTTKTEVAAIEKVSARLGTVMMLAC